MLYVGTCSACGTGNIGIRIAASGRTIVGMCDERDSVWLDPMLRDGPHYPEQPELPCPGDGSSLRNEPAHWATLAEAADWTDAILGETVSIG